MEDTRTTGGGDSLFIVGMMMMMMMCVCRCLCSCTKRWEYIYIVDDSYVVVVHDGWSFPGSVDRDIPYTAMCVSFGSWTLKNVGILYGSFGAIAYRTHHHSTGTVDTVDRWVPRYRHTTFFDSIHS